MSHQLNFDFASDGSLAPGPPVRAMRKRAVPTLASPAVCVQQDICFTTPAASVASRAPVMPRRPVVVPAVTGAGAAIRESRRWCEGCWTARVIWNEGDDAWAVEMLRSGEPEPALVVPWPLGPDYVNPKPLDQASFDTLLKTASEILQRHERQLRNRLHKRLTVSLPEGEWGVTLEIVPDEYEPYAVLVAFDASGEQVAQERVMPDFRLTEAAARAWIKGDFRLGET
jgi:hypothetical protein